MIRMEYVFDESIMPEIVGTYAISKNDKFIPQPLPPAVDPTKTALKLTWSIKVWDSPQDTHYPRYKSEPLLKSVIDGGKINMSSVHLVISRNALRKLFSCFMPFSWKYTKDFNLTVEQVSDTLSVIRECNNNDDNAGGPVGFALDFEEQMTNTDPNSEFSLYYEAVSYNIGQYKVVVGCEVDALTDEGKSVELKTSRNNNINQDFFQNAWLQMKLAGTNTLYLGKIACPNGDMSDGDKADVTVECINVNEVRNRGNLIDADEKLLFANVANLLCWIKEKLPFNSKRRIATLSYTKKVDFRPAKPEKQACPALPAFGKYPARPALPSRPAQDAIPAKNAKLIMTVEEFSEDQSTISDDFFKNFLSLKL